MSYIGSTPTTQSFIAGTDYFNGDGTTVNFTLSRAVNSVNDIEVIVNNVEQIPSGYSVSGTTLTFSAAPSAGTSNVYVRYLSTTNLSLAIPAGTSATFNTVTVADGSATTPSITNDGDTNTGIFFPAADTIAFAEGGAEVMRIDSSGNVGIGTASPSTPLNIVRNAAGAQKVLLSNNSSSITAETAFSAFNGTAEASLRVAGSSYVGYGAYTANNTLVYNDTSAITIMADNASNGIIKFAAGGNSERARINANRYFKASNTGTYQDATGNQHELRANNANGYVLIVSNTNGTPLSEYIQDWRFTAATPNNTSARFWNCEDATVNRAYLATNGGLANYSANNSNLSDRREKTNFAPAKSYLDVICAIPVQTFNYIDQNMEEDAGLTLGVVAQDVQAVAPEMVMESNWGTQEDPKMRLSIYQTDLQYALMKCIQEQQALITALTTRITALENNNATQ